jgi:hypothetical protein
MIVELVLVKSTSQLYHGYWLHLEIISFDYGQVNQGIQ